MSPSSRVFERHTHAVAEHRLNRFALERIASAVGDPAGHAVQVDGLLPPDELPRDAAGVDAESVKTLKLPGKAFQAPIDHHRGAVRLPAPQHVYEAKSVQVRRDARI